MHYNWKEKRLEPSLPNPLSVPSGIMSNPPDEVYEREGWVLKPVVLAEVSEGRVIIPGTQKITYDEKTKVASLAWDTETEAEHDARVAADKEQEKQDEAARMETNPYPQEQVILEMIKVLDARVKKLEDVSVDVGR